MTGMIEQLENGVVIHQATDEPEDKCNIYCEFPWCPPDSHCFVYVRNAPEHDPNTMEYVSCGFVTWETRVVGRGCGGHTMANGGRFYFKRLNDRGAQDLVECDLQKESLQVIDLPEGMPASGSFDISRGGRYVAFSKRVSLDPQMFGVGIADLHRRTAEMIHEDPYVCNTHVQFEPSEGRQVMVQHNRGCIFAPDGTMELLCGKEGCTLFLLEVPGGAMTRLPVGPPHTASLSGHETWLGQTGELIATLNDVEDYDYGKGRIIGVRPGEAHREICAPWELNHIGIEPSGRILAGDAYQPDQVIIGSTQTNKATVVCQAKSTYNRARRRSGDGPIAFDSHPHAYISPDRKWVVFNSDRTGVQQIYAAEIPEEMIETIERTG